MMLNYNAKNEVKKKDQAIAEIFYVKESSILIHRENFEAKIQGPGC